MSPAGRIRKTTMVVLAFVLESALVGYPDGTVFSVTNTELPVPKQSRPNVKRLQFARCTPPELVRHARDLRPATGFRPLKVDEAAPIYQELYAEEIRFRKGTGA